MKRTFKGFPVCEKHGITYRWEDRCCKICKREKKPIKKLDEVLRQMENDGMIPKVGSDDKNGTDNN